MSVRRDIFSKDISSVKAWQYVKCSAYHYDNTTPEVFIVIYVSLVSLK
jgi:hypothetical protein